MGLTSLQKIQAAADRVRAKLNSKGFGEYTVTLISRTEVGKSPLDGTPGAVTEVQTVINPAPDVTPVKLSLVAFSSGVLLDGDIKVSGITRTQTAIDALINNPATIWLVAGPGVAGRYSIVGGQMPIAKETEWIVYLRKRPNE